MNVINERDNKLNRKNKINMLSSSFANLEIGKNISLNSKLSRQSIKH